MTRTEWTRGCRLRIALAALAIAMTAACGDDTDRGTAAARSSSAAEEQEPTTLAAIAHPDLAGVSPELRDQVTQLRAEVESSVGKSFETGSAEAERLGQAWGDLARAYHAYGFHDAAAGAYGNARALQPGIAVWSYLEGLLELERGRHDVAVERLRGALEIDPDLVVAQLRLGEALLDLGRPEDAVAPLETAARSKAHAAAALAALGRAARDRGDAERARDLFEQALVVQPSADLLHHSIGLAYRSLGDETKAKSELALAGTIAPSYPDAAKSGLDDLRTTTGALLLRGSRALVMEQPHEAVAQYRRAVEAAPEDADARRSLALALRATGELDDAQRELTEAVRLAPNDHVVLFDLGYLELARGAQQAAADAFGKCLAIRPDFVPARFNLANSQLRLGQAKEALANLERVLELDPTHRRARYQAAMAKAEIGRREEGRRDLEALIAADPEFASARLGKAGLDQLAGDRAAAKAGYEEVLKRGGDPSSQVDAHLALAALGGEDGRPEVAIEHLRAATKLAPDRDDLRDSLARALEGAKLFAEAAEERRALAELRPAASLNRMLEAYDWVQAGRSDLARERLEQGVKERPEDRALANSLARLLATAREDNLRNGPRAVEIARNLYADQPSPDVTETLAMALAESGDFEQAIAVQQGLIAQVRTAGQTGHLPRLEANLRRYEKNEPVRM